MTPEERATKIIVSSVGIVELRTAIATALREAEARALERIAELEARAEAAEAALAAARREERERIANTADRSGGLLFIGRLPDGVGCQDEELVREIVREYAFEAFRYLRLSDERLYQYGDAIYDDLVAPMITAARREGEQAGLERAAKIAEGPSLVTSPTTFRASEYVTGRSDAAAAIRAEKERKG